jgi:putative transposase
MDFFTVEAVTWAGLVRYRVLFVIALASRRVEVAGVAHQPHEAFMKQMTRNLTDAFDGFLVKHRFVIMERESAVLPRVARDTQDERREPVRLPSRSPNLNAYAERWIGSARVFRLRHPARRNPHARAPPRVHSALSYGAKSSITRQQADRADGR